MELTGQQIRQLHAALLSAFPTEDNLRILVRIELDKTLDFIATSDNLSGKVFKLIEWAEAHGELERLIRGAQNTNPDNPVLRAFIAQLPATMLRPPADESAATVNSFAKWRPLLADLQRAKCTPILGPGLLEPLLGTPREMARRWAARHRFPLAAHIQDDLPQVAQFLATVEQPSLGSEFRKALIAQLLERHGALIPAELRDAPPDDLLRVVAAARWARDPADPYRILADLPCPIYVSANPDNLLAEALQAAGKAPEVELCRWLDRADWPRSVYDREPDYQPTVERPLVYHLFGWLRQPFSLVLKEDDYFDYLVGVTRRRHLIPPVVREWLADSALLFLGFRMDDWSFRVLFRSIIGPEALGPPVPDRQAADQEAKHPHVTVQLDPQTASAEDLERARYYMESYFGAAAVTVYPSRVEQFLQQVQVQWARYQGGQEVV